MNIDRVCAFLLGLVLVDFECISGKKSYSIRGNRFVCKDINPKFLQKIDCSVKLLSRSVELYNGEGTLHPNITLRTLHVRMAAYIKFSTVYRPLMLDTRVDVCGLYSGATKYSFMVLTTLNAMDENVSQGCPVSGTRYVRDLKLYHSLYPDVLPSGVWRLDHEVYTKDNGVDEPLLTAQMFFIITHNDSRVF